MTVTPYTGFFKNNEYSVTLDTEIADGQSLSDVIDLKGMRLAAIILPSGLAGTSLTFQVSADGTTWADAYKTDDSELEYTVAASRAITDLLELIGVRFLKIRTGTSGSPQNQTGAKTLQLVLY